ncbi:MAG: Wzz/FepE/Etk N-terminal domain-containing protein [Acidobacteriota bacterium]|nr:Wzz/FepE/Etk N-terminal domain-containing protein [Acidobacteriota bacterium]
MGKPEKAEQKFRVAEEPVAVVSSGEEAGVSFLEPLIILARRKSFILKFVGAAAILAAIFSLLLPKTYTAKAQIMPPEQRQSLNLGLLSQGVSLDTLSGMGQARSDLYATMLQSRTVGDALIDRFSLLQVYKVELHEQARLRLAAATMIMSGKDGVISISVTDRDPRRAADLANGYTDELSKLFKTLAVSEASKRRLFFEASMKKSREDLVVAEQSLKETQEKTGLILLSEQSKSMIEALASTRARLAAKEVALQAMRSYAAPENPELQRAQQELAALRAQAAKLESGQRGYAGVAEVPLGTVPAAGLEYARKVREVKYQEALLDLLWKEYELARIDEGRDPVMVQQLDKAVPPEIRSWPKRSIIVLAVTLLALLVAIAVAFLAQALEQAREDPDFVARLRLLKFYLLSPAWHK